VNFANKQFSDKKIAHFDPLFSEKDFAKISSAKNSSFKVIDVFRALSSSYSVSFSFNVIFVEWHSIVF